MIKRIFRRTTKAATQALQLVVSNKDNNVKLMYCDNQGFEEWIPPGLQFDEKNV